MMALGHCGASSPPVPSTPHPHQNCGASSVHLSSPHPQGRKKHPRCPLLAEQPSGYSLQ